MADDPEVDALTRPPIVAAATMLTIAAMNTVTTRHAMRSRCELIAAPERGATTALLERSMPTMKSPSL